MIAEGEGCCEWRNDSFGQKAFHVSIRMKDTEYVQRLFVGSIDDEVRMGAKEEDVSLCEIRSFVAKTWCLCNFAHLILDVR